MRTESLWGADCFEELIKYIFVDFLRGFEDAMTMVSEELCGFGERGMTLYRIISEVTNNTIGFSSSAIPCR